MASVLSGPTGELRFEREQIDVTSSSPQPDPDWHYTDQHGHEHYRQDDDWPTIVWIVDASGVDADGDEFDDGHWQCRLCGEHIRPGMRGPSGFRESVPGRTHYYFNDHPISEAEYNEIREAWRAQGR